MRLTHSHENGVLFVILLSTSRCPRIHHEDLTRPFVVLAGKGLAAGVFNFSPAEQTCCWTPETKYVKCVKPKKRKREKGVGELQHCEARSH